jgi:DNA-binding MarR family transcriptional regulator
MWGRAVSLTPAQRAAIAAAEAEIARIIAALCIEHELLVESIEANADTVEIVAFNVREIGE